MASRTSSAAPTPSSSCWAASRTASSRSPAAANPDSGLFDADTVTKLSPPAEEVLSFIVRKEDLGEQVTVKTIVDTFQAKPYGWDLASIEVLIAFLVGSSKVTLTVDGNVLKRSEVAAALRNTQKHSHIVVAPQKTFDERKVAAFRKFCTDFFDEGSTPKDPLELARHGADKLKGKRDELKATVAGSKYPFVDQLAAPIDLLDQVVGKSDDWYLNDFNLGDDLLDAKENLIDPIQAFLNGAQRVIYDEAAALLTTHSSNLSYLPSAATIPSGMRWPTPTPSAATGWPSSSRQPTSCAARSTHGRLEPTDIVTAIEGRKAELVASAFYAKATTEAQESVLRKVDQTISRVGSESQVALIREIGSSFEASVYPALLDQLVASPAQEGGMTATPEADRLGEDGLGASASPASSKTEEDVDQYLAALRNALVQTLKDGKRISL